MAEPAIIEVGLVRAAPLEVVMAEEQAASQKTQAEPLVSGLAAYIKQCWSYARDAKQQTVEPKMIQNMRARRGEYDPEKMAAIREAGGSEIYANLTSTKCRAAASWLRDVLVGTGGDRPWSIHPTPIPDLPPEINKQVVQAVVGPIMQALQAGIDVPQAEIMAIMSTLKDQALAAVREDAGRKADRMADKMEDQLVEGNFLKALDEIIDDITTFPAAILKGPIVRRKPRLTWQGNEPVVKDELTLEWERVSPFNIYPSPASTEVDDGYLIERHKLSRQDLQEMIGVDGYDDATIRVVLDQYGQGGLREWLTNDVAMASAEGKATTAVAQNPEGLIDALQYWGSVQGKMLREWGMTEKEIPDPTKEYHVEAWLIGPYVIKAVLNYDPMHRRPYYKVSYEEVPGTFWGNSVADLVRDPQVVANAAARAMVNNMGIASGPQVGINVDRVPQGEQITSVTPWKIWQYTSDPVNGQGAPIQFWQPDSRIQELMAVFQRFSDMADEYSGIPKYMTGESAGGAGRTASGMSMMIQNAGKTIKQVLSNVDMHIITPLLERLYYYNMRYSEDPELKGDVQIVARGAASLVAKESAQVRRNEFLAATANPIDMQIVGVEGRAALLRESAKNLDMNADKIVPPPEVLKLRQMVAQQAMQPQLPQGPTPANPTQSGEQLMNGAPVTDNFAPKPAQM